MRPLPTLFLSTFATLMVPLACTAAADEKVHDSARTTVAGKQNSAKKVLPLAAVREGSAAGKTSAETSDDGGPVIRVRWEPVPAADTTPESTRDFAVSAQGAGELPSLQALEEKPVNPEHVEPPSPHPLHPAILRELSALQSSRSAGSGAQTYLDELHRLRDEPRPWLGIRTGAGVATIHSAGTSPQWLEELTQLNAGGSAEKTALRPRPQLAAAVGKSTASVSIAKAASEATPISVLFSPISTISLSSSTESGSSQPTLQQLIDETRAAGEAQAYLLSARPGSGPPPTSIRLAVREPYALHHNPLYFEDPDLERCGVSNGCLTPAVSALRFVADTAVLPWRMAVEPPTCEVRSLGDCRTGHEFPAEARGLPVSLKGMAAEAGVITALIFIIP